MNGMYEVSFNSR